MRAIRPGGPRRSIWDAVHRWITRPFSWALLLAGLAVWLGLAVFRWFQAGELTLEWLAAGDRGAALAG